MNGMAMLSPVCYWLCCAPLLRRCRRTKVVQAVESTYAPRSTQDISEYTGPYTLKQTFSNKVALCLHVQSVALALAYRLGSKG